METAGGICAATIGNTTEAASPTPGSFPARQSPIPGAWTGLSRLAQQPVRLGLYSPAQSTTLARPGRKDVLPDAQRSGALLLRALWGRMGEAKHWRMRNRS